MPRYIDADYATEKITKYCEGCNSYGGVRCRACQVADALDIIDESSTVDVYLNRHAHWIEKNNPAFSPFDGSVPYISYCSHCGKIDGDKYPFCHVCGFKMDEEAEHE